MNESCYALDRYKQSLFEFNARGECLSVTETPFMANSIFATSDAFWLYISIDTSSIPAFFFDNLKRHCPEIIREDNPVIVFCQLKKTISSDGYEI